MPYLADTNVAARWTLPSDIHYTELQRDIIYTTAQVLIEFHALATRPIEANGLGLTSEVARREAKNIEAVFPLLPETEAIYPLWGSLIDTYKIVGRQVYDARLVAVMQAHGITHILTLNPTHFRRFTGVTIVEPKDVY